MTLQIYKIASYTVTGSGVTQIQFSSIPSTYTDLCLMASIRSTEASVTTSHYINFNGVTTNRSMRYLWGTGAAAASGSAADGYVMPVNGANSTASTFSNLSYYIPNYAGSNNKSLSVDGVMENNATTAYADLTASLWSNTAAITSIELTLSGNQYATNSTATLYGIL